MTAGGRPAPTRWLSRLIGAVLVGWLIVYNVMRLAGSNPADAAWPSLAIGAGAALVLLGLGGLAMGLPAVARLLGGGPPAELTPPARRDDRQRTALALAWPALAAAAVAAIAVGAYLIVEALGDDEPGRPSATVLILTAWNVLAGLWLGDEALRARRGDVEGLDSAVLGCILTAVLAGVGLARSLLEPGQVVLIVLAGAAGTLASHAVWRLRGSGGMPLGAAVVALVAALSLLLPLVL